MKRFLPDENKFGRPIGRARLPGTRNTLPADSSMLIAVKWNAAITNPQSGYTPWRGAARGIELLCELTASQMPLTFSVTLTPEKN
jgi:hypothetical protein